MDAALWNGLFNGKRFIMKKRQKRYQYWGKFGIKWTEWFNYNGQEEPIQIKGFKGNDLRNEYRTTDK